MVTVTLSGPRDVVAVLPYQLGFHPRDSVVAAVLRGRRMGMVARADLVPDHLVGELVAAIVPALARERPDALLLVGYEDVPGRAAPALEALADAADDVGHRRRRGGPRPRRTDVCRVLPRAVLPSRGLAGARRRGCPGRRRLRPGRGRPAADPGGGGRPRRALGPGRARRSRRRSPRCGRGRGAGAVRADPGGGCSRPSMAPPTSGRCRSAMSRRRHTPCTTSPGGTVSSPGPHPMPFPCLRSTATSDACCAGAFPVVRVSRRTRPGSRPGWSPSAAVFPTRARSRPPRSARLRRQWPGAPGTARWRAAAAERALRLRPDHRLAGLVDRMLRLAIGPPRDGAEEDGRPGPGAGRGTRIAG